MIKWGPIGKEVYERTYRRKLPSGDYETWSDTCRRVSRSNCNILVEQGLVSKHSTALQDECEELRARIEDFTILPAGRHLWTMGTAVPYTNNCWHVLFEPNAVWDHFTFLFLRLMEGGGVGSNYSNTFISKCPFARRKVRVNIYCDEGHKDFSEIEPYILRNRDSFDHADSLVFRVPDSREGFSEALHRLLWAVFSVNEGTSSDEVPLYFDVSDIRPRGSEIKTFGGTASGPISLVQLLVNVGELCNRQYSENTYTKSLFYMLIDHMIAEAVICGGVRRSARMSLKHWADYDIMDFIRCKDDPNKHWSTNISVVIDEDFIQGVTSGDHECVRVYNAVIERALVHGEPGFVNIDAARSLTVDSPYSYSTDKADPFVTGTNPCGELWLEPYESCCLGHVNLANFDNIWDPRIKRAFELVTRFLIRATFVGSTDRRSRSVVNKNRRIGVGFTGFQTILLKSGIRYSKCYKVKALRECLNSWYAHIRKTANEYAFSLRIPAPIKVTTIAPTGTVSLLPGVSSGCQPIYAKYALRRVCYATTSSRQVVMIEDYRRQGYPIEDSLYVDRGVVVVFPYKDTLVDLAERLDSGEVSLNEDTDGYYFGKYSDLVESAEDVDIEDYLKILRFLQKEWADNAISFTINFVSGTVCSERLGSILVEYLKDLKGVTLMPDKSRPQMPFERITKEVFDRYSDSIKSVGATSDGECSSGGCPIR